MKHRSFCLGSTIQLVWLFMPLELFFNMAPFHRLSSNLHQLQKKTDGKVKKEKSIEEVSVQPNYKVKPKIWKLLKQNIT